MPYNEQIEAAINSNDSKSLRNCLIDIADTPQEINALNDNNDSYLHLAAKKLNEATDPSYLYILELLLEYGVNPAFRNRQDKSAFELCHLNQLNFKPSPIIRSTQIPLPHLFNLLIENGVNVNHPSDTEISAVCVASAMTPDPKRLAKLLERGADIFIGYGNGFNPLAHALNRLDDLCQNQKLTETDRNKNDLVASLQSCISLLLTQYGGIGFSFSAFKAAVRNINFEGKVLIAAEFNERIIAEIPSLKKSIRNIHQLDIMLKTKQNPGDELKKIKLICLKIARSCSDNDKKMLIRVTSFLAELDRKWPELKSIHLSKENKPDEDDQRQVNPKTNVISKLHGLFKDLSSSRASTDSSKPAPGSSQSNTPQAKG